MTDLKTNIFGIPSEYEELVKVVDCRNVTDDGRIQLKMLRAVAGYRELYAKMRIEAEPSIASDADKLAALMSEHCPIDPFDSGICFLVEQGETPDQLKTSIVCRSDDYTQKIALQPTLIQAKLQSMLEQDPNQKFRLWYEGSIIRVFTIMVGNVKQTFYATRSKIDCARSRWVNDPNCPGVKEEFNKACRLQGIRIDDIKQSGTCIAFVLRSPHNQMKEALDEPKLVHFRSYSFADGEYREVSKIIPGAIVPEELSPEAATRHILDGKVVITTDAFVNMKIMTHDTARVYSWMETSVNSSPELQYYSLLSESKADAARFLSLLRGYSKKIVEKAIANLDENIASTAEYILHRLDIALKAHWASKIAKKGKPNGDNVVENAYKSMKQDKNIDWIIRSAQRGYAEARKAAIESGRFKPFRMVRGKDGKERKVTNKFYWGGSADAEKFNQLTLILGILNGYKEKNGKQLLQLIKRCAKYKKSEIAALRKLQKDMKGDAPERPTTPTFDLKAQAEIDKAVKALEAIEINEDELFLPDQTLCASLDDEWDDAEDNSKANFDEDE